MKQIYSLRDPRTNEIKYVGQCSDVRKRGGKKTHPGGMHLNKWMQSLRKLNLEKKVEILEVVPDNKATERELFWIEQLLREGEPLLNVIGTDRPPING